MRDTSIHEARWLLLPLFSLCVGFVVLGVIVS